MDRAYKIKLLTDLLTGRTTAKQIQRPRKMDVIWGAFDELPEQHRGRFQEIHFFVDGKPVSKEEYLAERERQEKVFGPNIISDNKDGMFGKLYFGAGVTHPDHVDRLPDYITKNLHLWKNQ